MPKIDKIYNFYLFSYGIININKEVKNLKLGKRLADLRKEKGITQEELANKLYVTRKIISKWETDNCIPNLDEIVSLCEVYGITPNELIGTTWGTSTNDLVNKKKKTLGLVFSIFLYFLAIIWIIISTSYFMINEIIAISIFLLICAISTCIMIYTQIIYKQEKEKKYENKSYKQIESILSIITLIVYLSISFVTMAWHITWFIWIIYALIMEIVKLVLSLRSDEDEK